jgi:MFS family permease
MGRRWKNTRIMNASPHGSDIDAPGKPRWLMFRLSLLIFLAFGAMGAWMPVFSRHLQSLGFAPDAIAWASATNAIGSLLAPLIWGQIADRWLAPPRCISVCGVGTGVLLLILATLDEPASVIGVSILTWFFLIPLIGVTAAYIFRMLEHPERQYGPIRLWGTLGWMAANWCLTGWFALREQIFGADASDDLADSMRLGAIAAFVTAMYAWTVPSAPILVHDAEQGQSWLTRLAGAPLAAIGLFRRPAFLVYCVSLFGLYMSFPVTVQLNALVLGKLGVADGMIPTYLTLSQTTEVMGLAILPSLLTRFGLKPTMVTGCLAWAVGLLLLSIGAPLGLVLAALPLAGFFICGFVIAGQVFVHRQASHDIRASAQGVLVLVNGTGLLLGHLLVGWIRDLSSDSFAAAYGVAAALAGSIGLIFLVGFRPEQEARPE